MEADEFVLQARIDIETLDAWIDAGWLLPHRRDQGAHYSDVDVARAHLIHDLRRLGINDEGVPVVLDLIDQVHGLRRLLRQVLAASQGAFDRAGDAEM